MATPAEYCLIFLDLELFAHFHVQKGFRSGLIDVLREKVHQDKLRLKKVKWESAKRKEQMRKKRE